MKGVKRFGNMGKISPHYVVPYIILSHVGKVDYELESPTDLALFYPVFHVSFLIKCIGVSTSVILLERVDMKDCIS